jgi:hypothetical protein
MLRIIFKKLDVSYEYIRNGGKINWFFFPVRYCDYSRKTEYRFILIAPFVWLFYFLWDIVGALFYRKSLKRLFEMWKQGYIK